MYIATVPNRRSPPAILLRESYRENGKVKTRTLGNLSHLPADVIQVIRRSLKGDKFIAASEAFEIIDSRHHGHVQAVLTTIKRLGIDSLIASHPSRERDLVVAMLIARIIEPSSKLATTRWWHTTTLPHALGVTDADEGDLYATMDWLLERQQEIEKKLAARHLREGGVVLYDLSSSYFEGDTCPLAALGYNRDGKKGKLQVNYGLLTDSRGCPVAVPLFKGNTTDGKTLMTQVRMMQERFNIHTLTLVGDRGMISQKHIDGELRDRKGIDWITALKNTSIRKLVESSKVQLDLFDEQNLFELTHPDFPNERLIACRNPALAKQRCHKRQSLLEATQKVLEKAQAVIKKGKLYGQDNIRGRVNKLIGKELADYFAFDITDEHFSFQAREQQSAIDAAYSNLYNKLEKIALRVNQGKLKGDTQIRACVNNVMDKKLASHFKLTIDDDHFSFHDDNKVVTHKAAFDSLEEKLQHIVVLVEQGRHGGKDKIGLRVGRIINKYKMAKHFVLDIHEDGFNFHINTDQVSAEAALDGVYMVRTSVPAERLTAGETVRTYKSLSQVERAFRSFKTIDLKVRPIHHRLENRVRAHIFLAMLAYYVQWHMIQAWRPLLFCDEDQQAKHTRDPVAPAQRSEAAQRKAQTKRLEDGTLAHSFQTLLQKLSTIVSNICRARKVESDDSCFEITTTPNAKQQHAYDLLKTIKP